MIRFAAISVVALIAALPLEARPTGASAATQVSGLRGLATLSPTRPVCIEGEPCSRPAARVVLSFQRSGMEVARVRTQPNGWYRVLLRPGKHTIVAAGYRVGSGVTPRIVRVIEGRIRRVDLDIDTGIQ
jgi:hypothetical protein